MKRKGFVFTLDALLSMLIVVIFVTSVISVETGTPQRIYSAYMLSQDTKTAEDVLYTIKTVPLNQLVPPEKVSEWISNGVLNTTLVDPTMSPLDIVSTYWAVAPIYTNLDLKSKAEKILGYVLNMTLGDYNYQLLINNYTSPYLSKSGSDYGTAGDVSAATITVSGRAYNKSAEGYVARLYLAKITKQDEYIYMSDAVLGYPYYDHSTHLKFLFIDLGYLPIFKQDNVRIFYNAFIPDGIKYKSSLFFMPSRYVEFNLGNIVSLTPGKVTLLVNNNTLVCNGKSYSNYQLENSEKYIKITDSSTSNPSYCNLLESINPGNKNIIYNEVTPYTLSLLFNILSFDVPWLAIGDSGSSYFTYIYKTTKFKTYEFPHIFHFPDIQTENPTQIEKALLIPYNITSMNIKVSLYVPGDSTNVTLRIRIHDKIINMTKKIASGYSVIAWNNNEILNSLESAGIQYRNLTGQYFYVVLDIGLKDYEDVVSPYEYGLLYDDEPTFLREKFPRIEGGFRLIGNESYVEIKYDTPPYSPHIISLHVPINITDIEASTCNGEWCTQLEWAWKIPNSTPIYTKFKFPYFWNKIDNNNPSQRVMIDNNQQHSTLLYCHGNGCDPNRGLLKVFNHWGYGIQTRANNGSVVSPTMAPGENRFTLEFGDGFYVSKDNSIGETLILLDSYVPYGDVFPYLLQGYPDYTGYNLTYYYTDINGEVHSHNLLIGVAYLESPNYRNVDIDNIVSNRTYKRYALDDAIVRLFKKLGGRELEGHHLVIPVRLDSTISDVIPLHRVPSLYKPLKITLRTWREGS